MAIDRDRGSLRGGSLRSTHYPHPHGYPPPHPHHAHPHHYVKPFGEKVKDCCRSTIAFIFSNVGVCGLMVGYTIMGAYLFHRIEGKPMEIGTEVVLDAEYLRNKTIERLWNVTESLNVLDESAWRSGVSEIVETYQQQVVGLVGDGWTGENTTIPDKWSIEGGFLYSLTVITTIDSTPKRKEEEEEDKRKKKKKGVE